MKSPKKETSDEEVFELEECLLLEDDKEASMNETSCQESNRIEYIEYNEENVNNSATSMDHLKNARRDLKSLTEHSVSSLLDILEPDKKSIQSGSEMLDVGYYLHRCHKRKFYESSKQLIVQNDRSSNDRSSPIRQSQIRFDGDSQKTSKFQNRILPRSNDVDTSNNQPFAHFKL